MTLKEGPTLPKGHQTWMMNEINPLIWPSPDGIGEMPVETWDTTVKIMLDAGLITEAPGEDAERAADLARSRVPRLEGLPPETAYRRLVAFLVRRGHEPETARRVARAALAVDASDA